MGVSISNDHIWLRIVISSPFYPKYVCLLNSLSILKAVYHCRTSWVIILHISWWSEVETHLKLNYNHFNVISCLQLSIQFVLFATQPIIVSCSSQQWNVLIWRNFIHDTERQKSYLCLYECGFLMLLHNSYVKISRNLWTSNTCLRNAVHLTPLIVSGLPPFSPRLCIWNVWQRIYVAYI